MELIKLATTHRLTEPNLTKLLRDGDRLRSITEPLPDSAQIKSSPLDPIEFVRYPRIIHPANLI